MGLWGLGSGTAGGSGGRATVLGCSGGFAGMGRRQEECPCLIVQDDGDAILLAFLTYLSNAAALAPDMGSWGCLQLEKQYFLIWNLAQTPSGRSPMISVQAKTWA